MIARDVLSLIGNTPLLRLRGPSEATGCTILGKCEFLNPGQSAKDRAQGKPRVVRAQDVKDAMIVVTARAPGGRPAIKVEATPVPLGAEPAHEVARMAPAASISWSAAWAAASSTPATRSVSTVTS